MKKFKIVGVSEENGTGMSGGLIDDSGKRHAYVEDIKKFKRFFIRRDDNAVMYKGVNIVTKQYVYGLIYPHYNQRFILGVDGRIYEVEPDSIIVCSEEEAKQHETDGL